MRNRIRDAADGGLGTLSSHVHKVEGTDFLVTDHNGRGSSLKLGLPCGGGTRVFSKGFMAPFVPVIEFASEENIGVGAVQDRFTRHSEALMD